MQILNCSTAAASIVSINSAQLKVFLNCGSKATLLFLSLNSTVSVCQIGSYPLLGPFHCGINGQSIYSFGSGWVEIADLCMHLSHTADKHQRKGTNLFKKQWDTVGGVNKGCQVGRWRTSLMPWADPVSDSCSDASFSTKPLLYSWMNLSCWKINNIYYPKIDTNNLNVTL